MPVDPELRAVVDAANSVPPATPTRETVGALRELSLAGARAYGPGPELRAVEDRMIPGPRGDLAVRVFVPEGEPIGVLVFFHGSGFVIYDLDSHDKECRLLAAGAGVVVVSVDYALAPEIPFPGAVDDCLAATRWVATHGDELGVAGLPLAVGGDSAGGNLAAVVSMLLRDDPDVDVVSQMLVYPVTDLAHESPSYVENGEGYLLSAAVMRFFVECYTPDVQERLDPRASPLLADDLTGLPTTLVVTAEYDPLRDEGEAYARALQAAGVRVTLERFDGAVHGFWQMTPISRLARDAMERCVEFLGSSLAGKER
jgi:acetyl esterase/lipase